MFNKDKKLVTIFGGGNNLYQLNKTKKNENSFNNFFSSNFNFAYFNIN